jgi:hypothetical protein
LPEILMNEHKFHRGELVKLISAMAPRGIYRVVRQLPHNGRHFEYRLKHSRESFERIAPEHLLDRIEESVG